MDAISAISALILLVSSCSVLTEKVEEVVYLLNAGRLEKLDQNFKACHSLGLHVVFYT